MKCTRDWTVSKLGRLQKGSGRWERGVASEHRLVGGEKISQLQSTCSIKIQKVALQKAVVVCRQVHEREWKIEGREIQQVMKWVGEGEMLGRWYVEKSVRDRLFAGAWM